MFEGTKFDKVLTQLIEKLNPLLEDIRAAENKRAANEKDRQDNEEARQSALVKTIDDKSTYSQYASAKAIYELFKKNIVSNVFSWLDAHPEATTTVQDASLEVSKFTNEAKKYIVNDYVTPQMFGAVGDGVTDDTEAFNKAQNSGKNVYVPSGSYVLENFTFKGSANWTFQCATGEYWWYGDNVARILTSTGVTIGRCGEIRNLIVKYNGSEADISKRPSGIRMSAHHTKLVRVAVSYFNIGMEFGGNLGHCDYVQIYNLYSTYNYFAGVSLNGNASSQINNISFYDGNVGASGVTPHDRTVEPAIITDIEKYKSGEIESIDGDISEVTKRGYAFYISCCNSVLINNIDMSANETCSIYIDTTDTTHAIRGLSIPVFYAEANKYCDIFYNNGSNTRNEYIDIKNAYIYKHSECSYYANDLVIAKTNYFISPTINFLQYKNNRLEECYCNSYELFTQGIKSTTQEYLDIGRLSCVVKPNRTYRFKVKLRGLATGNSTLQNAMVKLYFDKTLRFYRHDGTQHTSGAFNIPVVENETQEIYFYIETPDIDEEYLLYSTGGYGAAAEVLDLKVEDITKNESTLIGIEKDGALRWKNNKLQVYVAAAFTWKDVYTYS